MARHGKRTAGIGIGQGCWPIFAIQPAFQEARHEPVTRAQNVKDINRETGTCFALVQRIGDITSKGRRPHGTAFTDQGRPRHRAYSAQRLDRVGCAACDVEFFLCSHNQVEQMQRGLQFCGNGIRGNETVFTVTMPRQPPQVGTIINVQRCLTTRFAGQFQRL